MPNEVTVPSQQKLVSDLAVKYDLDPDAFKRTIIRTCFSPEDAEKLSKEEFFAFLMVANKHGLDPMTREIYAMRKKGGGIVPVVGVDGWLSLMNRNPNFDGMTYTDTMESLSAGKPKELVSITCQIFRKDRAHPISATEYMAECRQPTQPWQKWPARMLRHKATIQAARLAFSFAGIVDPDEADRIKIATRDLPEREELPAQVVNAPTEEQPPKRGPGRPRKVAVAPPAPPEEPTVQATQDAEPVELVEYADPDSGELRHVTVEEYDRLLAEENRVAAEAEQRRQEEARAAEKRRKAEELRKQLAELDGTAEPPKLTEEQRKANGALTEKLKQDPAAIPAFLKRDKDNNLPPPPPKVPHGWADPIKDPNGFLKRFDVELARLNTGDEMQELWDRIIEPLWDDIFPPDRDECQKLLRHHMSQVEP